jgi:hypothetical protein
MGEKKLPAFITAEHMALNVQAMEYVRQKGI